MAKKNVEPGGAIAEAPGPKAGRPVQGVNKQQAIAEALRELGRDASAQDLIGYAQQKFGVKVTPQYVSVIRSNLRKKGELAETGAGNAQAEANPRNGRQRKKETPARAPAHPAPPRPGGKGPGRGAGGGGAAQGPGGGPGG